MRMKDAWTRNRRSLVIIAAAAAALAVAGGGIAYASIPDSSGVIHGCYKANANGNPTALSVIDTAGSGGHCPTNQKALDWNQTGPQGPTGATGATGPAGPPSALGLQLVQANASVPNDTDQTVWALTASCPSGYKAVGGGFQTPGPRDVVGNFFVVLQSRPGSSGSLDSNGWFVDIQRIGPNDTGNLGSQQFAVWANCLPTS
jgi:hypothetical protein